MPNLSDIYESMLQNPSMLKEAIINVKFEDEPAPETLRMPDIYARKVLGYAGRLIHNVEKHIEEWAEAAKWGKQAREFLKPALLQAMQASFNMDDIETSKQIIKGISDLIESKEHLTNFTDFVSNPSNTNFLIFFNSAIAKIPSLKIFAEPSFINRVINFEFSESKVAVGPGEVFVTLFSEVVNPAKGDLFIPSIDKEIELKASGGRAGKSNVVQAANKAFKHIKQTLGSTIDIKKNQIVNELFDLAIPFKNIKLANDGSNFNKIINMLLQRDEKSILNLKFLTQVSELNKMAQYGERKYSEFLSDVDLPHQIMNKIQELGGIQAGGETKEFRTFFNIMDYDEQINLLQMFSPSNIDISAVLYEYIEKLSSEQLLASIQINDYQQTEKFDYIMYFNNTNYKCQTVGSFTEDYITNLRMILNVASQFKVSVGTGGGRGGAQVYVG